MEPEIGNFSGCLRGSEGVYHMDQVQVPAESFYLFRGPSPPGLPREGLIPPLDAGKEPLHVLFVFSAGVQSLPGTGTL